MDIELNLSKDSVDQAHLASPLCVEPSLSVREVLVLMRHNRASSVCICRDGRLAGIFTERDALRAMQRRTQFDAPIESIMSANPSVVSADASVARAILRMSSGGYRRLPIVDATGRPVGVIETSGIVHYLVEHFPQAIYNLPPVAHPVSHEREGP